MSNSEILLLRGEVAELREELVSVQAELARLRRVIAGLRAADSSIHSHGSDFLGREPSESGPLWCPRFPQWLVQLQLDLLVVRVLILKGARPAVLSWAQREELCERIGSFIRRALSGDHRGSSGRDLNPLSSRFWLVARSIDGVNFDPPRVFRSWSGAKALVKRGAEVGDSVFVGLPSEREITLVIQAAELRLPATFEQ